MSVTENRIITKAGREKLCKARSGEITLPKIVGVAFGRGGVDPSGTVIPPSESQTELADEIGRKVIDGYEFPVDTTCRYTCTLGPSGMVGEEISELGLYDEDGDIVCIKTFTRKGKDANKQAYVIDDIF